jgi:hypothetical protein
MYTDRMVSLVCISLASRRRLSWVIISLLVLALSLANFQAAVSQNVNFTFSNFDSLDNLTLRGDALPYYSWIILNALGTAALVPTCGALMYQESVRLLNTNSSSNETRVASFSTAFTFSMNQALPGWPLCPGTGDGLAFLFSVDNTIQGDAGGSMCAIHTADDGNSTNHMFSVEFDTFRNEDAPYYDPSDNHVGVNINSMDSVVTYDLCENSSSSSNCTYLVTNNDFSAWIDFYVDNRTLEVRLANGSITEANMTRPLQPLIALALPEIDTVFLENMYVGFTGSVYNCKTVTTLKSWSFYSGGMQGSSPVDASISSNESMVDICRSNRQVAVIAGVSAASGSFLAAFLIAALAWCFLCGKRRSAAFEQTLFWPRKFTYKELATATDNFSVEHLLGSGGFGEVYKGTLCDDSHIVAVKRMKHDSKQGEREFSAEISVISQIRHRNLVQILGWCRENNQLLLVYEYMSNSSLDVWLFDCMKGAKLTWNLRYNILRGLAAALAYLHEEWEQCIVHRDIKASNVMLDGGFNAHLGDFGLARLIDHDSMPKSTTVAGTLGYLAPELPHTRKATKQSDVYSYGVLALEIACGRPVYESRASAEEKFLQDTVWEAHEGENILSVADTRLHNFFDTFDMNLVLTLGLLCCHPEPDSRPTMRFVHQCIIGEATGSPLPSSRPDLQSYSLQGRPLGEFGSW